MEGIEEDDGYSDDVLDALPVDDFQELQLDAIRSTQQQRVLVQHQSPDENRKVEPHEHSGALVKTPVYNNATSYAHQPSSDYGDFDDEMLDGEIFDAADQPSLLREWSNSLRVPVQSLQPDQWGRHGRSGRVVEARSQTLHGTWAGRPIANALDYGQQHGQQAAVSPSSTKQQDLVPTKSAEESEDTNKLQAQINALLRANEQLKKEADAANSEALSKSGEISIVRANRAKEKQEEERRLAAERKLRSEEQAKYNAEVVRYNAELQKLATDKAFVENDLAREAGQRKGASRASTTAGKSKITGKENTVTTPKKIKDLSYGDGFNEDEIQVPSPSKLTLRSKPATPKAGAKRKRKPTENSPVKPLQLSQGNNVPDPVQPGRQLANQTFSDPVQVQNYQPLPSHSTVRVLPDERFEITQKVLDHRLTLDDKRTVEALSEFSLPSQPNKTLSSIFLDGLSPLSKTAKVNNFAATIGLHAISLWSQCMDASMYSPVVLLMDLVRFILIISKPGTAHHFMDDLTPLAQRTADLNLIPRIRRKPPSKVTAEVKTKQCLEILHLMAYDCLWQKEDLERFWRCMRVDFIAMALKIDQPIEEITIALDLLRASVLEDTFAMIRSAADGDQESSEQGLLQILSSLFIETPRVAEGQDPYDVTQVAQLRLEVLSLLEKMCETDHGGEALAKCVNVFVRLVRFMNDEIASLYDYQHGHEYRIELINESMRLLYHITTTYSHLINIQERLATTPGGAHKYLIVLTRLNFSDGIFYEQGIEDDVVECAQHLLENWVTPEEGEALVEAFSSARR